MKLGVSGFTFNWYWRATVTYFWQSIETIFYFRNAWFTPTRLFLIIWARALKHDYTEELFETLEICRSPKEKCQMWTDGMTDGRWWYETRDPHVIAGKTWLRKCKCWHYYADADMPNAHSVPRVGFSNEFDRWSSSVHPMSNTVETAYKVAICPRGNLLYIRIYLITDLKLPWKGVFGL